MCLIDMCDQPPNLYSGEPPPLGTASQVAITRPQSVPQSDHVEPFNAVNVLAAHGFLRVLNNYY